MGTDAYGVIQRKTDAHGFITVLKLDYVERDYYFFSLLSGARCYCEPLIQLRGLPNDSWDAQEIEEESSGDHSKTWLTLDELRAVRVELAKHNEAQDVKGLSVDLDAWIAAMEAYGGETRIVLWFDS